MSARPMSRDPQEEARRKRAILTGLALAAFAVCVYVYVLVHSMGAQA